MHSSWFRKPVHKVVSWLTILIIIVSITAIWLSLTVWPIFLILSTILISFLIASSFIIQSGVYITTINRGDPGKNTVAITFDDGPCEQTSEILLLLEKYKAKASFFLIGNKIERFKDIVKQIHNKKHTIGSHSYHHNNLFPLLAPSEIEKEISDAQQIIKSITGYEPVFFRPPFGVTNPLIAKAMKQFKVKTIGWSVRSLDTVTESPDKIINRIMDKIKPGSIVLLHDTSKNVIPVLEELLLYCAKINLQPVSLDDFLQSAH